MSTFIQPATPILFICDSFNKNQQTDLDDLANEANVNFLNRRGETLEINDHYKQISPINNQSAYLEVQNIDASIANDTGTNENNLPSDYSADPIFIQPVIPVPRANRSAASSKNHHASDKRRVCCSH